MVTDEIFVEVSALSTHEVHKTKRGPVPKSQRGKSYNKHKSGVMQSLLEK